MSYREFLIRSLAAVVAVVLTGSVSAQATDKLEPRISPKPRLLVLTDMTSIQSGVREPDDAQSMIRLMLYADVFDIEGLIAGSGLGHGHVVRPQNIRRIVDAYGKVRSNLVQHDKNYPTADSLRKVIKRGQPVAGEDVPVYKSIGQGKDTPASRWIIKRVDAPDSRPLWISIWGGSADLAQALWTVKHTRSPEQVERFIGKIRVLASGDQDSTGPWIKSHFPTMYYMTSHGGGRGMYRGGDQSLVSSAWVQNHIKGHGALGDLYPDYRGRDPYSYILGEVRGIKSGDSPQFMGLITNGLNAPGHLTWENWGGRNVKDSDNPHHYHVAIDKVGGYRTDISPYLAAVYRWRPDFQADLAARFDWCIKPYRQANHAPVGNAGVASNRYVAAGNTIKLDSGDWSDPDGDRLTYDWQFLKEESSYSKNVRIENKSSRIANFSAPALQSTKTVHVLLTVTDNNTPALSAYKRFNFIIHR